MATITWLADVLRAEGCTVREEGDWRSRGRPGEFNPVGVLWHHTVGTSSSSNPAPSLDVVINGRSDLNGPLCHALIDYNGVFRLVAAGRANHAGSTRSSGPIPADDGNTLFVGWEIDYQGVNQRLTQAQYDAAVLGTAAVLRRLGRSAEYARGHKETSTDGKIDPGFVNLDTMRADVAARLGNTTDPKPEPPADTTADDIGTQLLFANDAWHVLDIGARTYWIVASSTLLRYLVGTLEMRIASADNDGNILTGFTRIA